MVKKLAVDWDDSEVRLVAAQCSGSSVRVIDAAVVPIGESTVAEILREAVQRRQLSGTETLVVIGRGKAELREIQLPPVPDDELPDMVRFQAIRSFASAGDSATVDYLVTNRTSEGVSVIAAAVGPAGLDQICETCASADLETRRIALRPLAAAALYLSKEKVRGQDVVLIDLLADDAEIVVARDGGVIFVRTVRLPTDPLARGRALSGELKRSLVACGSSSESLERVILWGRKSVHRADQQMLQEASGTDVDVLDPFQFVSVEPQAESNLPDHVGRLAPLVGALAADEVAADRLIDFLNPRKRVEAEPSPYRRALAIGIPVAAVLLLAFFLNRRLANLDAEIADLKLANAQMQPNVDRANQSVARTESIDRFLDGNVNWLSELTRMAESMPGSDEMIVREIFAKNSRRVGGGTLKVAGSAIDQELVHEFEQSLRDSNHNVQGSGASERPAPKDEYVWDFAESISVDASSIRNHRYAAIAELIAAETTANTVAGESEDEAPIPASELESDHKLEIEDSNEAPPVGSEPSGESSDIDREIQA